MGKLKYLAALLFASAAHASVTLTISVATINSTPQAGSYVRADLQNCIHPTIVNSSAGVTTPQRFYLPANSTTLTITVPDNVTQIACSGNQLSYWTFTYVYGITQTVIKSVELPPGVFTLANLANLTTPPWNPGVIQGPQGEQGLQGVGPPYFGLWVNSYSYLKGDTASYNNATYISLVDNNLANVPSTSPAYWAVYVDPSGVSVNPSISQTINTPNGYFLNLNNALFYDGAISFGTAANTPDSWISRTGAGAFCFGLTEGACDGTIKASTINTVTGYQLNGGAPSGHILIGNGTRYVDGTIPAASTNYQTVQSAGVAQTTQPILNFLAPLVASNNGGNTSTDVTLQVTGVTAGVYPNPTFTVDAYGRILAASSGTLARTCNSNGCYITFPDGTLLQWGRANSCGGGSAACNSAVTFPVPFSTTVNLSVTTSTEGGGANNFLATHATPSTTGFNVQYGALIFVGGGGGNLSGSQTATWIAVGN